MGAYLGLTPKRYQSGDADYTGRISRCGDRLLRCYLYEAAYALLSRVTRFSPLKAWGVRFAGRHGGRKARVAIARKLSVIMHRMLITRDPFHWSPAPCGSGRGVNRKEFCSSVEGRTLVPYRGRCLGEPGSLVAAVDTTKLRVSHWVTEATDAMMWRGPPDHGENHDPR